MASSASRELSLDSLDELQHEIARWRDHNFPNHTAWEQLLGVVEEVGELAHAEIKSRQGIRGRSDQLEDLLRDGIGDLIIFLMGYAQRRGFLISECVARAWDEVKERDWVKYPGTGLPPKEADNNASGVSTPS